jgi:flagellin-like protein
MIKSKRGIEPVIATVLLIVITIAVIGVLVAFLYPYIKGMTEKETACRDVRLEIDSTGTCTNGTGTWVMVSYSSGNIALTKAIVQVTTGGSTSAYPMLRIPGVGGAETYFTSVSKNAAKVGAIPYVEYNGKEYMCDGGKAELTSVRAC